MQAMLLTWKDKFEKEQVNYNEILTYTSQQQQLQHIGETLCASSFIIDCQYTETMKNKFLNDFEQLNILLIMYSPGQSDAKWCTLPSLLQDWGVALPPHLLDMISQYVVLPGEKKAGELLKPPPPPNTNGIFQPGHDVSLKLTKGLSLRDLSVLVKDLKTFLLPFKDVLDTLVFFKLHPSEMFDKYLRVYLRKEGEPKVKEQHSTPVFPVAVMQPLSEDQSVVKGLSLHVLQRAVVRTHELIMKLMQGTAAYSEIVAQGQLNLEKVNLKQEFDTLHSFSPYLSPQLASYEGLDGVQKTLELFQYVHYIQTIHRICEQYQLQGCLKDPQLIELYQLAENLSKEANRAQLTPIDASEKVKKVENALCLDSKAPHCCIELFTAVGNSANFYLFVREKHFVGDEGQAMFQQQYQLITAQLQHEEYNETVLNHLYAAFKIIEPFMDNHQSFQQLMSQVTRLDVTNGVKQLQTVNSNITLIQLWFSRAEVSVASYPGRSSGLGTRLR